MKNRISIIFILFLIFSFTISMSYAQPPPCDIYVDNNTNCDVDIQFDLFDFSGGGNCNGNLNCLNGRTDQTNWITVPANTTGYFAVDGTPFAPGGWGIARIADADGTGNEEWDGFCGTSYANPCTCSTRNYGVQFTRTSNGVTAVIQ